MKIGTMPGIVALLAFMAVALTACKPKLPEPPPRKKMNVEVWVAEAADLEEVATLPGIVKAEKTIRLSAEIAASVKKVHVDVGSRVQPGQTLLEFDETDLLAYVKQAEAGVAGLQARLREVEKGARDQQVREAEAGVKAAKAGLDLATTIVERRKKLSQEKLLPLEALDQALMQLQQAQSGYDRAREIVDLIKEGATEETKQALQAQLDGAKAGLSLASNRLKKAVVKSPMKGIVIRRFMDEMEFTGPGAPLFDVIPATPVVVSMGVPERIFGRLNKSDQVRVTFPILECSVTASITMLAPAANPRSQTFAVEIDLDNPIIVPDPGGGAPLRIAIRPGLIADVRFVLGIHDGAVSVPGDALVLEGEALFLYVLKGAVVRARPVMIGMKRDGFIEITEGLKPGESLVVEGQKQIRDGDEVKVVATHTGPVGSWEGKSLTPDPKPEIRKSI